MENQTKFETNFECPVHRAEPKAEYDFGMMDATLTVYECRCCSVHLEGGMSEEWYFKSYEYAEGFARLAASHANSTS